MALKNRDFWFLFALVVLSVLFLKAFSQDIERVESLGYTVREILPLEWMLVEKDGQEKLLKITQDGEIILAENDGPTPDMVATSDPLASGQWYLDYIDNIYATATNREKYRAMIVDTGIPIDTIKDCGQYWCWKSNHEDLQERLVDGVDWSQDDILENNFFPFDKNGHGTAMNGFWADTDNFKGIAAIYPYGDRINDKIDFKWSTIGKVVYYRGDEARRFNRIYIFNGSWSSVIENFYITEVYRNEMQKFDSAGYGIIFVHSAGNLSLQPTKDHPGWIGFPAILSLKFWNVISVTAVDSNGKVPSWANVLSDSVNQPEFLWRGTDIWAPGVAILTTAPFYASNAPGRGYVTVNGASFSCAIVSASLHQYLAKIDPPFSEIRGIKDRLRNSARHVSELAKRVFNVFDFYFYQPVSVSQIGELPQNYKLSAYPNPFNPSTTIEFTIPESQQVYIEVVSVLGQTKLLIDSHYNAGTHTVIYNADGASGVYFVRMFAGNRYFLHKLMLIR